MGTCALRLIQTPLGASHSIEKTTPAISRRRALLESVLCGFSVAENYSETEEPSQQPSKLAPLSESCLSYRHLAGKVL